MSRFLSRLSAILFLGLLLSPLGWGQSRIPANANVYLQNSDLAANGDVDGVSVLFFQVPVGTPGPIYFQIFSPGTNNGSLNRDTGTGMVTDVTLIGGTGAFTGSDAKRISYVGGFNPYQGTVLEQRAYTNNLGNAWDCFNAVDPSQGEKIGNQYYFKLVVDVNSQAGWGVGTNTHTGQATTNGGAKNAFQVNISSSSSTPPTGVSNVRAFAYKWTVCFFEPSTDVWHFYPLVPDNAANSDWVNFYNWDSDNGESWSILNRTPTTLVNDVWSSSTTRTPPGTIGTQTTTISNNNVWGNFSQQVVSAATQANGTWDEAVTANAGATAQNTASIVVDLAGSATSPLNPPSGTILPIYSSPYTPAPADHVTVNPTSQTVVSGAPATATLSLQIVDASGNPVPYVRNVRIVSTGTGSPTVNSAVGNDKTITTDVNGSATFTVVQTGTGTASVALSTNGSGAPASSVLTNTVANSSATVDFNANPNPTISSIANSNGSAGTALTLSRIVISANGGTKINTTSGIWIRRNSALASAATFDSSLTSLSISFANNTFGTTVSSQNYVGGVLQIALGTANFASNTTMTIGLASPTGTSNLTLTSASTAGSGQLEVSWDGGTTWVSDDKFITLVDTSAMTWNGSTSTDWSVTTNWSPNGTVGSTSNVTIPNTGGLMPVLTAASNNTKNLTIAAGATLTLAGKNLTLNSGTFSNSGTLILQGGESLTGFTNDTAKGTVQFTTSGTALAGITSFYNLENASGSHTAPGGITVNGDLIVTGGTLTLANAASSVAGSVTGAGTLVISALTGVNTLSVGNNWSVSALTAGTTSTVAMTGAAGAGPFTITSNGQSFANLTLNGGGKIFQASGALTATANLGLTAGTLAGVGNTISFGAVSGSAPVTTSNGTITATGSGGVIDTVTVTGGVTLNGGGTGLTITNALANAVTVSTGKVNIKGSVSTLSNAGTLTLTGNLTASGAVTNSGGTLTVPNTFTLTMNGAGNSVSGGSLVIASGGIVTAGTNDLTIGASGTLNTSGALTTGNFTSSGAITNTAINTITSSGTVAISGTFGVTKTNGTVILTGAASALNASTQIGNLQVNSTATAATLSAAVNLAGTLIIQSSGVLSASSFGVTVNSGSTTIDGTLNGGSGTDSFLSVAGLGTLSASSGSTTIGTGGLSVTNFTHNNGSVTLTNGTINAYHFYDLIINGTVTAGGDWIVDRNWTLLSGTFTPGTNTVFLSSTAIAILAGSTTFYNLQSTASGKTIKFTDLSIQTVTNSLDLEGLTGTPLVLTGTSSGGWTINMQGASQTLKFLNVSFGNAATNDLTAVTSFNGTSNNGLVTGKAWKFPPSTVTWTGSTSTSWSVGSNWNLGYAPNSTDFAVLPDVSAGSNRYPVLFANTTVATLDVQSPATLGLGGFDLSVSTTFANAGTVTVGAKTLSADTISGSGVISITGGTLTATTSGTVSSLTVTTSAAVNGGTGLVVSAATYTGSPAMTTTGLVTLPAGTLGALTVSSGTLTLGTGTLTTSTVSNAGTIVVAGNTLSGTSISGAGTVSVTAGTLTMSSGGTVSSLTVTTSAAVNGGTGLVVSAATYTGSPAMTTTGLVTLPAGTLGALTVSSGTLTLGTGTLTTSTVSNAGTIVVAGNTLSGTSISGAGTVSVTAGTLTMSSGGTVSSLTVTTSAAVNGGTGLVVSAATYTGSPAMTTTGLVTLPAGTLGALTVSSGTLTLGTGTLTTSTVSNAGTIVVAGNTLSGTSISGAGTVSVTAGTLTMSSGGTVSSLTVTTSAAVNGGTGLVVSAATYTGSPAMTTTGLVTLPAGTLGALTVSSGTLTLGTGTLTTSTVSNAGTIVVAGNTLSGTSISGAGTVSVTAGTLTMSSGGTVSSLTVTTSAAVNGGTGLVVSAATYTGSPAMTTTGLVTLPAGTLGALTVSSGTLTLGTGTLTTSTVSNAGTIVVAGNTLSGTSISGAGTVSVTAGTLTMSSGGTVSSLTVTTSAAVNGGTGLVVSAATYTGSPAMTTTGLVTLPAGTLGALTVSSGTLTLGTGTLTTSTVSNAGTIVVAGNTLSGTSISGAGTVSVTAGTLTMSSGGTVSSLTVTTSAAVNGGTGLVVSAATYTGSPAMTTTGLVTLPAGTLGALTVSSGTLTLGTGTLTTSTVSNAGTIVVAGNTLSGTSISGAGTVSVTAGTLTMSSGGTVSSLTVTTSAAVNGGTGLVVSAATYTGSPAMTTTGLVTLPAGTLGALTVSSGTLTLGTGTLTTSTVSNAGTIVVAGNTLSGTSISGAGTVSVTAGTLTMSSGGTVSSLTVTTSAAVNGGTGLVVSAATYTGSPAMTTTGLVTLPAGTLGALTVSSGTLTLGTGTLTTSTVSNPGTIAVGGNTLSFGTYSGAGIVSTTAGTVTATGAGGTITTLNVTTSATLDGGSGLTINNALTGNITANSGVLNLNKNSAGSLTVNAGTTSLNAASSVTTLFVNGTSTFQQNAKALTVTGNASIGAGTAAAFGNDAVLTVGGTTTIDVTASANMDLSHLGNSLGNVTATSVQDLTLTSIALVTFGTSTISGNLSVTAAGITQTASAINVTTGTTTLNAGPNVINLNTSTNVFGGTVSFSNTGSNNVTLNGGTIQLAASSTGGALSMTTTGPISQTAAVSVTGQATITAGTNNIDLQTNGATNSFGTVDIASGGQVKLTAGSTYNLYGTVSTSLDARTAAGDLTIPSGFTLSNTSTTTSDLMLLQPTGKVVVAGKVVTAQGAVTFNPGSQTTLNPTTNPAVQSTGAGAAGTITFSTPVVLQVVSTVSSTVANIVFSSSIAGTTASTENLTVNAGTGGVAFGSVGTSGLPLGVLAVTGGSAPTTYIAPSADMYAKSMTFTGPVRLQNTLSMSTAANNGNIGFSSTVDSAVAGTSGLTLNKGTGTVTFSGTVGGGGKSLLSLLTDNTGSVAINGTAVTTSTTQNYGGPVTLGAATTLTTTGSDISMGSTLAGAFDLTLPTSNGAGKFTVTGNVTSLGAGTSAALTVQNSVTGLVKFQGTVTAANGLSFGTSTNAEFDGNVTITGSSTGSSFGASGAVDFAKGTAQTFASAGDIAFSGTVSNSSNAGLTVSAASPFTITQSAGTWSVGNAGLTVSGNFVGTGGTLNGNATTALTFTTAAGSDSSVTLGTFTNNNEQVIFSAAAGRTITLLPNAQTFANVQVGNGATATTVNMTQDRLVIGDGKTLTITNASSFQFASSSAFVATKFGVQLGTSAGGSFIVNNNGATFNAVGAAGTSQVFVWGVGATPATLTNNNAAAGSFLFPTAGQTPTLGLANLTIGGSTPTVSVPLSTQTLTLEDSNVQLVNVSLGAGTTLDFTGLWLPATTSHDLKVSGNWTSNTTSILFKQNVGTPTTITFNGSGTQNVTVGSVSSSPNQQFQNVVLNGSGTVNVLSDLAVAGTFTQNASASLNWSNMSLIARGSVNLAPTAASQTTVTGARLILAPGAGASVTLTTSPAATLVLPDVIWAGATTASLTQGSDLVMRSLWAFGGQWNTGAHNLSVAQDFVALGTGYKIYSGNHPDIDAEIASRGSSYQYYFRLGYPYWGTTLATINTALTTATGTGITTNYGGTTGIRPTESAMSAKFVVGSSQTVAVGRNFYLHGASMTAVATTAWNLNLPTHWAAGNANGIIGASTTATGIAPISWSQVTLNSTATDWFGLPFAVAITTGPGMQVTYSNASQPVGAAQTGVAAITSTSNNASWDFTQPTISSAATRFDNLVEVVFSKTMQNANGEAQKAVNQITPADNLRFTSTAGNTAGALWDFAVGTIQSSSESATYTTAAATNANKTTLSFQTSASVTWNTDATGSGVASPVNGGQGATGSTDRSGSPKTMVPDLVLEKARLFDTSGNPVINYDGVNTNGGGGSTIFKTTADKARPVLVKVDLGQAEKNFGVPGPVTAEDGHNYWHLVWSEPVDLDASAVASINNAGQIGSIPSATAASGNLPAAFAFGDSFTDDSGLPNTVQLTGIAQYAGKLYRGKRSLGEASPQTTQTATNKVTNSVARSAAGNDLYVYLTGVSSSSGYAADWDGFWWGDTTFNYGSVGYTVPMDYVLQIKDRSAAANPVEDEKVIWPALSDPKANFKVNVDLTVSASLNPSATQVVAHRGWELDAPFFADFSSGFSEVVPVDAIVNDVVDQVQFHVLSNGTNSSQGTWDPAKHPDIAANLATNTQHYGVRDTSLLFFKNGFKLALASDGIFQTYGTGVLSSVDNTLFDGTPATGFNVFNDGYFTLQLNPPSVPASWKPTVSFLYQYDKFAGMGANLTGRLIESTGTRNAIDRTPPYIALTLAANGGSAIYLQFSRRVIANPKTGYSGLSSLVGAAGDNVFKLSGTSNGNKIVSIDLLDPSGSTSALNSQEFQQALIHLAKPIPPQDFATATIQNQTLTTPNINGKSTINKLQNDMDTTVAYPISNLGIDMVQPVWASDGSGGEANTAGTDRVVHDFTGLEALTPRDITVQVNVAGGTTFTSLPLRMFYDLNVTDSPTGKVTSGGLWLPTGIFQPTNELTKSAYAVVPTVGDDAARNLTPTASNSAGNLKTFVVPGTDPEMKSGSELQFIFRVGSLFAVRGLVAADPTQIGVYRVPLKGITTQKNGVTILHNVIDPTQGQKTEVLYTMKKSGVVTAQVFALDGSLVRILQRGRQAAGDYSLFWDGRNEGGKVVARGVYFIRVVAPDIDETRNVLVIK